MKNFFKLQLFLLMFLIVSGDVFAAFKLNEGFEGTTFPPPGWTMVSVEIGDGDWFRSTTNPKFGVADATSFYSFDGGDNYLISKRFVPAAGDSLVFWMAQDFTTVYEDTLKVRISTTDSLVPSLSTILLTLKDGEYPLPAGTYGRFAISLNAYAGSTCWIGFEHKDLNGDDIKLDGITVGTPIPNEVTIANVSPLDTANTQYTYAPKASFTNTGTNNQFNFTVTYQISGPVLASGGPVYSSTKPIDTLLAGQTKTITFDSTFTPVDSGKYNVNISSSVGLINSPPLATFIFIMDKNRGAAFRAGCPYWWSNSVSANALPNRPKFSWKDPNYIPATNKVVMVENNVNLLGDKLDGSLDDGNYDYGDTLVAIGKCIRLCGVAYNGFYPGTNGVIGLTNTNTPPADMNTFTISSSTGPSPALLPLWRDFNLGDDTVSANNFSWYISSAGAVPKELIITWENAVIFSGGHTDYVSFQACIELLDCGSSANSNIRYNYNSSKTGAGFKTKYGNGQPPTVLSATGFFGNGTNMVGLRTASSAIYYRKDGALVGGAQFQGPLFTPALGSLAVEFATFGTRLDKCNSKIICVRFYLEGWRLSGSTLLDTVHVSLRSSVSPYPIAERIPGVFDILGNVYLPFGTLYQGTSHYLTIEHRNTIRTWSNVVVGPAADTLKYNFTSSISQAFGSNQILVGGVAAMYSGDVNQDGIIDLADAALVDNDVFNFASGYVVTDVNGDLIVDLSDAAIVDNNSFNFISEVAPPGPVVQDNVYTILPSENIKSSSNAKEESYRIWKLNEELKLSSPVRTK